jgi:predicted XRE-type DNA-binding protein
MRDDDPVPELKRAAGAELTHVVAGWNGDDIAYVLGTDRFRVAELRRGKLDRFSLETLLRFLARAGYQIQLCISDPARPLK